ncbi:MULTISPECIES: methyltransferase domain-containing protein [Streptomyces]|uniref:methyltransferase domain-containing protein n=1 Tax=Streptomyces TaxID=1883 RepID=UPI001009F398|nr:methyltransferase domain-containing protein [Streptomyces roseicoloratus]
MSNTQVQTETDGSKVRLIALLDVVDDMPDVRQLRQDSYELLKVGRGTTVVDVGCGTGRAVAEMTDRGARAIGLDLSEEMIGEASRRRPDADFRCAEAYQLPFGDGEVDAYRAEKLYHELDDPVRALREARRVLVPGGRTVLIGQDWDTFVIDSDEAALTRTIVHARADLVPGARTARRYRSLLLDGGFRDVVLEVRTGVFTGAAMLPMIIGLAEGASAAGAITRADARRWIAEQRRRAEGDRLFLAIPLLIASATRT